MRAARLRFNIDIEQRTATKDPLYNEDIIAWVAFVANCPANVEAKGGREFFADNQRFPETVVTFTVRWEDADGVTNDMRIRFDGDTYNIKNINPDYESRRFIKIQATAGTGTS